MEMEEKQLRVEEFRGGKAVYKDHVASILMGTIDSEALKHISPKPRCTEESNRDEEEGFGTRKHESGA